MSTTAAPFSLISAETREPAELSMQRLWLTGQVLPAGARLIVEHVFRSGEKKPLEVIYSFPCRAMRPSDVSASPAKVSRLIRSSKRRKRRSKRTRKRSPQARLPRSRVNTETAW